MQASLSIEKCRVARICTIVAGGNAAPTASRHGRVLVAFLFGLLDYRFAPHANWGPRAEQTLVSMIDDVAQTLVR